MKLLPTPNKVKEFYALLGVAENASNSEIQDAWHRIALANHPDRNGGKASEQFNKAKRAYEVLRDPKLRAQYDAGGADPTGDAAIENLAMGMMANMLGVAVDQMLADEYFDPVAFLRDTVGQARSESKNTVAKYKTALAQHKKVSARIEKKWKGAEAQKNTALMLIQQKIEQGEKQLFASQTEVRISEKALQLLKDASFEVPMPPPMVVVVGGFGPTWHYAGK